MGVGRGGNGERWEWGEVGVGRGGVRIGGGGERWEWGEVGVVVQKLESWGRERWVDRQAERLGWAGGKNETV